jgi:hypothetical protein
VGSEAAAEDEKAALELAADELRRRLELGAERPDPPDSSPTARPGERAVERRQIEQPLALGPTERSLEGSRLSGGNVHQRPGDVGDRDPVDHHHISVGETVRSVDPKPRALARWARDADIDGSDGAPLDDPVKLGGGPVG